jgi:hypothetical protein
MTCADRAVMVNTSVMIAMNNKIISGGIGK